MPGDTFNVNATNIGTSITGHNNRTVINNGKADTSASQHKPASNVRADQDEAIDVGIIIALQEEFEVFFDVIGAPTSSERDKQTGEIYYHFERASSEAARPYRCIAILVGDMGSTPAALKAERMLTRKHPTTLVLPGLAGSFDDDVMLGDVVVADQVDGYLQNARANPIQGQQEGYEFSFSSEVYRPSHALIREVQNFRFSSPAAFQAWQSASTALQKQLLDAQLAELSDLLRPQARIHCGHIASGPIVGAAQSFKTWLKQHDRKYLALEMEALGVMQTVYKQALTNNTSTLILRAISDYGDEGKGVLDKSSKNAIRSYAMQNAIRLLWGLLDSALLPQASTSTQ